MKIKHLLFLLLTLTSISSMAASYTLTQDFTANNQKPATEFTGADGTRFTFSGNKLSSETSWGKGQYKFDTNTTIELTWEVAEGKSIVITAFSVTGAAGGNHTWFLYTNLDGKTDDCSKKGTSDQTLPLPETWAKKLRKDDKIIVQASGSSAQYIKGFSITYEIIDLNASSEQDITNVIVNPSAETNDGWAFDEGGRYLESGLAHGGSKVFETAGWWSYTTKSMSQTITNLPNGYYTLSAWRMAGTSATCTLTGNGVSDSSIGTGDQGDDRWQKLSVITRVSDGTLNIVASSNSPEGVNHQTTWANFDDFSLTYLGDASATMAVNTTAQYGTFCAPFAVSVPDGVTASTATIDEDGTTLVLAGVENGIIPANTPVILYAESGLTATTVYGKLVDGTPTAGVLTGVYTATPAKNGWYVLQNNTEGVGFYKVDTEQATPTVGANRCYMTVPVSEAAPRAFFFGGETTAIETISALVNNEVKEIYNANGVKQNSLQKGMNIIKMSDGSVKKIMVK